VAGCGSEVFATLTDKSCELFSHDDTDKMDFWKLVMDGHSRSYLMSASSNNKLAEGELKA